MKERKELEIYVHIPFCVRKCAYCDFLSAPADERTQDAYMEALLREIAQKSRIYQDYTVSTVFIGGGTPSCIKPEWIVKVMELLRMEYRLEENAEITMEMNPGTVTEDSLKLYYEAGINRLSMGLQSVHARELQMLGRIHSYEQFKEAYLFARKIGFSNINVDLMSGLPKQSLESYLESLSTVLALEPAPEHISAYSLIVEEGTPFYRAYEEDRLQLPDEDTERSMYERTGSVLAGKGYERYEISNYAQKGRECRHNTGYWLRKNYVGFGIGAASMVENVRFRNGEDMQKYIQDPCGQMQEREVLSIAEQMEETMFLGLRLTEGVSYERFRETFGVDLETVYGRVIDRHVRDGLLRVCGQNAVAGSERLVEGMEECGNAEGENRFLRLTSKGMDVSNYCMADFLDPEISFLLF